MKSQTMVGIYEYPAQQLAWFCRCFQCGWESRRFDRHPVAVARAKAHRCKSKKSPGLPPGTTSGGQCHSTEEQ